SQEALLLAYFRAFKANASLDDLPRRFHVELEKVGDRGFRGTTVCLLAIKIERRSIAAAVFVGDRLDYKEIRHLSSVSERAEASAIGFINWICESCNIESVALETMTNGNEIRRATLNRSVLGALRKTTVPIWEVSKRELLAAYGLPPLKS